MRKELTKQDILNILKKRNPNNIMIDVETGLKALQPLITIAENSRINWAIVGGIAMYFYNSPRLTKDVDVIAARLLPGVQPERPLGFGGNRYRVRVGEKDVPVDWIVRNDEARKIYQAALNEAVLLEGISIVTPEWLIVLKYIAGRFKDQSDAVFLLKQKRLVNRNRIKSNIKTVLGEDAWLGYRIGLQRWYDIADGVISTEREDYDPKSRIE